MGPNRYVAIVLARILIALLAGCGDNAPPVPDAHITVMTDDARADADCGAPGQADCCYAADVRACFGGELRPGLCAEFVCACEVVAACNPVDAGGQPDAAGDGGV